MRGFWTLALPLAIAAIGVTFVARARPLAPWPQPTGSFAVDEATYSLPTDHGPVRVLAWIPRGVRQPAPLVLYAPGWGNAADDNATLLGDLASHGYVAVAFDDLARDPQLDTESEADRASRSATLSLDSPEAFSKSAVIGKRRTDLAARKGARVLDALLATPSLGNRIDRARIGFVGYSFGGATGVDQSLIDPRIKAVVNIDGWLFGRATTEPVRTPYLLVSLDEDFPPSTWSNSRDPGQRAIALGASIDQTIHRRLLGNADFVWLRFGRMAHKELSDDPLHWDWRRARNREPADGAALAQSKASVAMIVRQFLDRYVKDEVRAFPPGNGHLPAGVERIAKEHFG